MRKSPQDWLAGACRQRGWWLAEFTRYINAQGYQAGQGTVSRWLNGHTVPAPRYNAVLAVFVGVSVTEWQAICAAEREAREDDRLRQDPRWHQGASDQRSQQRAPEATFDETV